MRGFDESLCRRWQSYAHLYLHMPLKLTITLASAAVRHVICTASPGVPGDERACSLDGGAGGGSGDLTVGQWLLLLWGGVLTQFGLLHLISADSNARRSGVRIACGVVLASLTLLPPPWQLPAFGALAVTVAVLAVQVLMDYLQWMQ